jgi:hypothetical protein
VAALVAGRLGRAATVTTFAASLARPSVCVALAQLTVAGRMLAGWVTAPYATTITAAADATLTVTSSEDHPQTAGFRTVCLPRVPMPHPYLCLLKVSIRIP